MPGTPQIARFRATVSARLGLRFEDEKFAYLGEVLQRRVAQTASDVTSYLARLDAPETGHSELRDIARELTIGETYFFRHPEQFQAFTEVALPACVRARALTKQLRLLSAGCSSGEEAFTLAILTQQEASLVGWQVAISGIDMNPDALERAALGHYSAWSLRETSLATQQRYFAGQGREYVLHRAVRDAVTFKEQNLVDGDSWPAGSLDVVFCRNALMYLTAENAARAIAHFAAALAPGGYLFLGSAETLRGLSSDFELCQSHGTFYYRRHGAHEQACDEATPTTLDPPAREVSSVSREAARETNSVELASIRELLAQERFSEALFVLDALSPPPVPNGEVLLLRTTLLTLSGALSKADQACDELLAFDGSSADAHYLRALCRERQGDDAAAVKHAQIAVYLDPSFAMPHLHLGLLARRASDSDVAQRELTRAERLLPTEGATRLSLFGSGFGQSGLLGLCRAELQKLGRLG